LNNNYKKNYIDFLNHDLDSFVTNFINKLKFPKFKNNIYLFGNGASDSIASHIANDFSKTLNLKAFNLNNPTLLTCLSNDYGYENWIKKILHMYAKKNDILILISSSGRSTNIVKAANYAHKNSIKFILLTGPNPGNIVKKSFLHLKIKSDSYNIIECCHMIALTAVIDKIRNLKIKKK